MRGLLGCSHLADARVHALGHVLLPEGGALGPWNEEQLQRELSDLVGRAAGDGGAPRAALGLDAAGDGAAVGVGGPLIEEGHVDGDGPAEARVLVVLECDVRPAERAVLLTDELVQQLPRRGPLAPLADGVLRRLLLPLAQLALLLLLLLLLLAPLLGRGEEPRKSGLVSRLAGFLGRGGLGGGGPRGRGELRLERELELEVVEHDEFKLLADGRGAAELEAGRW